MTRSANGEDAVADAAFGMQLRESRKAAALSLRQLAVRVGYDHSYLSQVERGQRPGSADLARLCDRELGTGNLLAAAYEQAGRRVLAAAHKTGSIRATAQIGSIAAPVDMGATLLGTNPALAPLEAAWFGLVGTFVSPETDECGLLAVGSLAGLRCVPPARLLPELVTELRLLNAAMSGRASVSAAVRAAQLSVLVAETLTGLGQLHAARRWWLAARATADNSGERWVPSRVRAREVVSGLAERRAPAELLDLADEALALRATVRPGCLAQAHAARARVLAELGRAAEAQLALQEFMGLADELPLASTASGSLSDWTEYEVHCAEGRVCARLGYGSAGCVLLARALELCPTEWLGERAAVEMGLAECLVVDGEAAAGVALAMRVLVELPDEWHSYYLYDAGERVLSVVRDKETGFPAARDLQELLARRVYLGGRSVGTGSRYGVGRE
jgi:transcriptional regulator with XRE-family HTH domain